MKRGTYLLTLLTFGLISMLVIVGCDDNDRVISTGSAPANPAFNNTFGGNMTYMRNGVPSGDTLSMTLSVNSPFTGTFVMGLGGFGVISGEVDGSTGTFTGTIEGPCPGSWSGTIVIAIDGDSIEIVSIGEDCLGVFELLATLGVTPEPEDEICDDQVDNDDDGQVDCDDADCADDPACVVAGVCGDGVRDPGEDCDDGNTMSCDGCSDLCVSEVGWTCGDGVVNADCAEECDDGNTTSCDGCSDSCASEVGLTCGDGVLNAVCGEQCDDGNTAACDGCSDTCTTETGFVCGDGTLNATCGEQCDDGNLSSGDGCSDTCMTEGGCAGAAAHDPNVTDCPNAAPPAGCAFDVARAFLPDSDPNFTCDTVCSSVGLTCLDAFDGDFFFCQPIGPAQPCSTPFSMIGGQPDMHCHCN